MTVANVPQPKAPDQAGAALGVSVRTQAQVGLSNGATIGPVARDSRWDDVLAFRGGLC
jgi:hypothetical protein